MPGKRIVLPDRAAFVPKRLSFLLPPALERGLVRCPRWPAAPAETGITFVAAGAVAGSASGSITPALPSGWNPNDIFLMFAYNYTGTLATPSGWNLLSQVAHGSYMMSALWRRAVSGDSAPTISATGARQFAVIAAWRGCATSGNPVDALGDKWNNENGSVNNLLTVSAATTLRSNTDVVFAGVNVDVSALRTYSSWSSGGPTPTPRFAEHSSAGYGCDFYAADFTESAAGSTGACNVYSSSADRTTMYGSLIALRPAPAPSCAVVFRAAGALSSQTTGTTQSPALPAGAVPDDILLCFNYNNSGDAVTISATTGSWTQIFQSGNYTVWYSRAVCNSTAPTIAGITSGHTNQSLIAAWSGCITSGSPIDAASTSFSQNDTTGDTVHCNAITTGTANDKLVLAVWSNAYSGCASAVYSSWAIGSLTPAQDFNTYRGATPYCAVICANVAQAAAGSTGTGSVSTQNTPYTWLKAALFALLTS